MRETRSPILRFLCLLGNVFDGSERAWWSRRELRRQNRLRGLDVTLHVTRILRERDVRLRVGYRILLGFQTLLPLDVFHALTDLSDLDVVRWRATESWRMWVGRCPRGGPALGKVRRVLFERGSEMHPTLLCR